MKFYSDLDQANFMIRGFSQMTSAYFWTSLTPCQQFYTIEFRNFNETPSPLGCWRHLWKPPYTNKELVPIGALADAGIFMATKKIILQIIVVVHTSTTTSIFQSSRNYITFTWFSILTQIFMTNECRRLGIFFSIIW